MSRSAAKRFATVSCELVMPSARSKLHMLAGLMRIPLWVPYVIFAIVLVILSLFLPRDEVFSAGQAISDPGQATLTMLQEIMKFVLSLNTAMLAGAGTLVVKGNEWAGGWSKFESLLIILVFLSGAVSYFGVYACHLSVLIMVNEGGLNPLETSLVWSLQLQYSGLIVGAFLLGLVFALLADRVRPRGSN